jgi:5-formyltetrahydrofolate cyclo-ligase
MRDTKLCKAELRSTVRQLRRNLSPLQQDTAAIAVAKSVAQLPNWHQARRIALYLATDGELDTQPLASLARDTGKQLFLPVINNDDSLHFAAWQTDRPLISNRYRISEPDAHAPRCNIAELDIVFLPLVAWDLSGGRLGMGGGFYDRTLSGVSGPLLVGLAHTAQQVDQVPSEDWDITLDYMATDAGIHCCGRAQANEEP